MFIFDNTYVLNSNVCRDVGSVCYATIDQKYGLVAFYAKTKHYVNNHLIAETTTPCDTEDLSNFELYSAKKILN